MDRNENLAINPGNGPATWQRGSKPQQQHEAQEFTSAMPPDRKQGVDADVDLTGEGGTVNSDD